CVVAGELERRPGDADCLRRDHGPGALERAQRCRAAALHGRCGATLLSRGERLAFVLGLAAADDPLLEPLPSPEQVVGRHPAVLEDDLAGVRGAAAELV